MKNIGSKIIWTIAVVAVIVTACRGGYIHRVSAETMNRALNPIPLPPQHVDQIRVEEITITDTNVSRTIDRYDGVDMLCTVSTYFKSGPPTIPIIIQDADNPSNVQVASSGVRIHLDGVRHYHCFVETKPENPIVIDFTLMNY